MKVFDQIFRHDAVEHIFSDSEHVQSMLLFEAALARSEAQAGLIPELAARAIASACRVENFDLGALAKEAAQAGNLAIPVVRQLTELVATTNKDAARFVHWGATSQDAIDTAIVLQLRRALEVIEQDHTRLTNTLNSLVVRYRATPIVARTLMQQALPTTFGFIAAGWMDAALRNHARLAHIREHNLVLQFGGAVGTLAALAEHGPQVAKALAEELHLFLPAIPWHAHRDRLAEIATVMGLLAGTSGKIARDISLHAQTEIAELAEPASAGRGGSSTLPHKRNPVTCAAVLSVALRVPGLVSSMLSSLIQEQQRALGAWQAEWETLPDIVRLTAGALHHLAEMLPNLQVNEARMLENLDATQGLVFAEAASMALAPRLGKTAAHQILQAACAKALAEERPLKQVLSEDPELRALLPPEALDRLFDPRNYLGSADEFISRVLAEASTTPEKS